MKKQSSRQRSADAAVASRGVLSNAFRRCAVAGLAVFTLVGPLAVRAQDNQVRAQPTRLTVPFGQSGTITTTIHVIADTNETINLAVGTLPAGVIDASLAITSFTENTGTGQLYTNTILTVEYDGSVPQTATNEIPIIASGDFSYRLPVPINSAVIWSGDPTNNLWAAAGNWLPSGVPTPADNVVFAGSGTSPIFNDDDDSPGFFTNLVTNVIISSDQTISGLRFAHGDVPGGPPDPDANYRIEIQSGATLAVTGTGGFSFLQDTIDLPGTMGVAFFGGGQLLVSNANANIALLKGFSQNSVLDMGDLDTFVADVNRLGLGDYTLYPNYSTNGYEQTKDSGTNAAPNRFVPQVTLAKTNWITASHVGGEDLVTNEFNRDYSMTVSKTEVQATGSGTQFSFLLGRTNVFLMESICFGGAGAKAENNNRIIFNTDTNVIPTNIVPVVYFRGADGTNRMSVFAVADASTPGATGSGTKANVNLTGGRSDALIDRLYIGRDTKESDDNDTAEADLSISGEGTLWDINTAWVSAQELGNVLTNEGGDDFSAEVYGTLNVDSNAVFKVHGTLHLGYTTADPGDLRAAETGNGSINIDGGIITASNLFVGGPTGVSIDNTISITGGGELVVSNSIGQTNKAVASFTMSDSTLTLHVDGNRTDPYVFAEELNTGGVGNTLRLASVVNVASFPATIPLISYITASPNFGVEMPEGFYGYIVNNEANSTVDVVILNTAPQQLVWNSGTWDTSSPSWKEGKIFANGDSPTFDDTAASSSVTVNSTVFVGGSGALVTNVSKAYTFSGTGLIGGTAPMNKWGANSLTMAMDSALPLILNEGTVTVNAGASVGSTTVRSNTTLTASGSLNRLTSEGTVSLLAGSSVANGAVVQGGTVSDSGTINGEVTVEEDATLTVNAGGMVNNSAPHVSDIEAGGSVVLNGVWENGHPLDPDGQYRINVFGTLTGVGSVEGVSWQDQAIPAMQSRLNIGAGGVFSPGSATGHMITFTNLGRFDFVTGARVILDVDMDSADGSSPWSAFTPNAGNNTGAVIQQKAKTSDTIWTDRWSTMTGTLVLNNVGNTPFTNGAVFKLFKKELDAFAEYPGNFGNRPDNDNQIPVIEPALPGLGLQWDLSLFRTNGLVSVVAGGPTTAPAVEFVLTNDLMVLYWPSNYVGWQVYAQTNELEVGLSTNWVPVPGTTSGTNFTEEIISSNPAVFYQLGLPTATVP